MSINKRLDRLENRYNPTAYQPRVICWNDTKPQYREEPQTKWEAVSLIRKRRESARKDLVLMPCGETVPSFEDYLMGKFNIGPAEL